MGSIDIIEPLSIVLSSAINKSQEHEKINYWECWELNPGLQSQKQVCYLCAMQPLSRSNFAFWQTTRYLIECFLSSFELFPSSHFDHSPEWIVVQNYSKY